MIRKITLFITVLLTTSSFFAQEKATDGPKIITQGTFLGKSIPLRNMPTIDVLRNAGIDKLMEVKQRFDPTQKGLVLNENALPAEGQDLVRQTEQGTRESLQVLENFDGITVQESGGFFPPDPTGAAGPNHYVHSANSVVKIFDKNGGLLAGPTSLGAFLGNGANNGDPIVMYDELADRFFVSQFQISNDALIIGISDTADPTGSYNVYEFSLDAFPDYPHYAIWHDGYYLTANKFNGNTTYVLDRQAMLDGDPNPAIIGFNLPGVVRNPLAVFSPEPAHLLGTDFDVDSPGYIVYLQDDLWPGVSFDHLKVWEIDIDFVTPANSTISANPLEIPTQPFDSFLRPFGSGDISQPNTNQRYDAISGVISYAANYRKFADHNSWVITFNSDIGGITPGIRWIELRNDDTNGWSIFQESTYAPADGEGRFMSSAAMDIDGNIGMGYSLGSENTFNSIKYTGRFDGDPLGQMTFPESTILDGTGRQTTLNRYGDYSHLTMDPDGVTFWFTTEYFVGVNQWRTRIASFKLNNGLAADVGVSSFVSPVTGDLGAAETVTINLFNFGNSSQSNFDIELRLDGALIATETYSGTLDALSGDVFTFVQTVDLSTPETTYEIEAKTILDTDENVLNDPFTIVLENTLLAVNDVAFNAGDFVITPFAGRQYDVNFTTTEDFGAIVYEVYNTLGQKVMAGNLDTNGNEHTTKLNFSAQPQGVFFVKLTNGKFQASKRLLVK